MKTRHETSGGRGLNRRNFIKAGLAVGGLAISGTLLFDKLIRPIGDLISYHTGNAPYSTFIGKVPSYSRDISSVIISGFRELGVTSGEIKGKRILLKPNLVENLRGALHMTTHPSVVQGAIEAFLTMGAASVVVAEGPGHCRDSILLLEESGMGDMLHGEGVPFVDLNYAECFRVENVIRVSPLRTFSLPVLTREVDWIVSMPKMKTHHWVGVTLSLKNLFGVLPGSHYGWPKNVLHCAGIERCIVDVNALLKPHFAIVDGVVGMEGDGPIMGTPKHAGVIVMGRTPTSVDATCVRIMGLSPEKVEYLKLASIGLGPIEERHIPQRGERIDSVRSPFALLDHIPAQRRLKEA